MPQPTFFNLPDEKRQKILQCAIDEFASHDFNSASISKIVARAGIAKGSLYQYFLDKNDLYHYLLDLASQKKAELLKASIPADPELSFFDRLRWLLREMARFQLIHPGLAKIGYRAVYGKSPLPADIMAKTSQSTQQYFTALIEAGKQRGEIRPEVDAGVAAFMFTAALSELTNYLSNRTGIDLSRIASEGYYPVDEPEVAHLYNQVIAILQYGMAPDDYSVYKEKNMAYTLDQKTIIITGANSGIGKAASIQLARLGATVVMACRSAQRGAQALEDVRKAAASDRVEMMQVDLSSQASIRQFAAAYQQRHPRLDVLIHNAANFDLALKQPVLTAEGVETIFATNHVGIFLMTHLLLDGLKASAPSRIITVASKGLMTYPFLDIEFDNLNGQRKFSAQHAYYHSKQAQVMYTYDLAERLQGTGVTVNCVRVGNVAIPDDRLTHIPGWLRKIYSLKRSMSMTPERQAETYIYLAADPALQAVTGGYWDENNRQVRSNKNSYNRETWKRLWDETARLAGIQ